MADLYWKIRYFLFFYVWCPIYYTWISIRSQRTIFWYSAWRHAQAKEYRERQERHPVTPEMMAKKIEDLREFYKPVDEKLEVFKKKWFING